MNKNSQFPYMGVMFLIFMTLKLCDVIDWSWWWVTSPLWGTFLLVFVTYVIVAFVGEYRRR